MLLVCFAAHAEDIELKQDNPNGQDKVSVWIEEHIQYPADAKQAKIEGRVIVEFIIDKDGSIIEPKIVKGVSDSLNDEALRLVRSMPRWTPGRQNGKAVQTRYTLPINFRLPKAK